MMDSLSLVGAMPLSMKICLSGAILPVIVGGDDGAVAIVQL